MLSYLFPVFHVIDQILAYLFPAVIRLCLWGASSGALAIGLYACRSHQERIQELKEESRSIRKRMFGPGLDFSEFSRLARRNLGVAFRMCGKVIGPALVSFVIIFIVVQWIGRSYSYQLPEPGSGALVSIELPAEELSFEPEQAFSRGSGGSITLLPHQSTGGRVTIRHRGKVLYSGNPLCPPVQEVEKKSWVNLLFESQAGYVTPDAPVDSIRLEFQRRVFVPGLPRWLGCWQFPFFLSLTAAALAVKFGFGVK